MIEFETDNRDPHCTSLIIKNPSDLSDGAHIDVDPFELFHNMLENCFTAEQIQMGADTSDLEDMLDTLKNVINRATSDGPIEM